MCVSPSSLGECIGYIEKLLKAVECFSIWLQPAVMNSDISP